MQDTVLLVVDVQTWLVQQHPYNEPSVIGNIQQLITCCRKKGIEVVYVRHDDGPGSELERNTDGWQIYHEIAPQGEQVFDKEYNSAFRHTGLKEYLEGRSIKNIILVGMQTEYCIDATLKAAFEYGFSIIIPEQTNTSFNNKYMDAKTLYEFYHYQIWNKRFARVLPMEKVEQMLLEDL